MNTLSTGELEFISLLCDLIMENEESDSQKAELILIDELDAHFHPDLQLKVIREIENLCGNKYVLITTHSPAVMMSVPSNRLFYLNHYSKCKSKDGDGYDNQIELMSEKHVLYQKLFEMYKTLMTDLDSIDFYSNSSNNAILRFAEEGLSDKSTALSADSAKCGDLQISSLKQLIAQTGNPDIIEVGCGVGRTLAMFKGLDKSKLASITYKGFDIRPENISRLKGYIETDEIKEFGLKSICAYERIEADFTGNICIFANVIHEITPDILASVLNDYFRILTPNANSVILEVLDLHVGEKAFVMQYPESIKLLFERLQADGVLDCEPYRDTTKSGIPLMLAFIRIIKPEAINISNNDMLKSLKGIVKIETAFLKNHYFNSIEKLNATSYSFHSHNLANAQTFISILEEQGEQEEQVPTPSVAFAMNPADIS
jgi:SAM-dependent methyltransferase